MRNQAAQGSLLHPGGKDSAWGGYNTGKVVERTGHFDPL